MNYVGIDHHRQYSHMKLMDQEGQVLRSSERFPGLGNTYRSWWRRRRSGRPYGRILTCAAFTNGRPAEKARTKPTWPESSEYSDGPV